MSDVVLSLFDLSGKMVKTWAEHGYDCYCVDIESYDGRVEHDNITYIQTDLTEWLPPFDEANIVFGFPPCTDLSVSGARWFESKRKDDPGFQHKAMHLVFKSRDIGKALNATWMVENPVSQVSSYWRKPNHTFHPYEYNGYTSEDNKYNKKTCLWTSDDFVMPGKDGCLKEEADDRIHTAVDMDDDERSTFRSMTPQGFANAVFQANDEEVVVNE